MAEADRRGVFISWSKGVAAKLAVNLKPFLEDVLGTATIFMSQAMEGGTRWSMEIPQRLDACNAGLVLVTKENSHEPWLHFEAGALSKHIDEARVVPLLCGATIGDIQGTPLSLFQAKELEREDFLSICLLFGATFGVPEETVRRRYEKSWPDLEKAVDAATKSSSQERRQLGIPDLMAVLERVAGQVTSIEATLRVPENALSFYARHGLFGNPLAGGVKNYLTPSGLQSIDEMIAEIPSFSTEAKRRYLKLLEGKGDHRDADTGDSESDKDA